MWYPRIIRSYEELCRMEPHSPHMSSPSSSNFMQFYWQKRLKEEFVKLSSRTWRGNVYPKCVQRLCMKSLKFGNRWRSPKHDACKFLRHSRGLTIFLFWSNTGKHTHTNTSLSENLWIYLSDNLSRFWRFLGHPARFCPQWRQKGERRGLQRLHVPQKASSCG